MKVQERKYEGGGFGGGAWFVRVVELAPGEDAPEGSTPVPDETPVTDWTPEA